MMTHIRLDPLIIINKFLESVYSIADRFSSTLYW